VFAVIMTPYSQITYNKRRTFFILALFIALFSGFFYLIGYYTQSANQFLILGLIFSLFSSFVSYFYSDKIVLFTVGARPADKKKYFDFYTVTENLTLAAGLPMPKLYVIDDSSPNAFATGRNPKNAVVCVTTGLLQVLDRSDLEGVIAHELSHIKNYDTLLATIVSVLVGTIALVSEWFWRSFWWRGSLDDNGDRKNTNPLLFLLFILTLILAPLIATLIQLAISRRREFLADASAVLLTRNPQGLIDALKKISTYHLPMRHATTNTAHLFIVNPFSSKKFSSWLTNLFNTHPPIEERIKMLEQM
jgi:heat shock protein HtpX